MTDQEINVAIAEASGWKHIHADGPPERHLLGYRKWDEPDCEPKPLPNYCNDLNAMHEATIAQNWSPAQQMAFMAYLAHKRGDFALVNATALQRAEALLRTLGKWKD